MPDAPTCNANGETELQVAKTFWDLDDINNEGVAPAPGAGADTIDEYFVDIFQGWINFPTSTANHGNSEDLPAFPENAVNLEDYEFNNSSLSIAPAMTHNATGCQSQN